MLQAELREKINGSRPESIHDRLEDILTSNVFGAFRYLRPEKGILPFLCSAKNARLETLRVPSGVRDVEWKFWPRLPDRREPDLLLRLKLDAGPPSIPIEAKCEASKHGTDEETSADEGVNETKLAEREDKGPGQEDTKGQLARYLRTGQADLTHHEGEYLAACECLPLSSHRIRVDRLPPRCKEAPK